MIDIKSKIKGITSGRKKKLLTLIISIIIGATIIGVNFWNYNNSVQKFELTISEKNEEFMTVKPAKDFEKIFQLKNPEDIQNLYLKVGLEGADPRLKVAFNVNGEKVETIEPLVNESFHTIPLDKSYLESGNELKISGDFSKSSKMDFKITSLAVTGYSNAQRYIFLFLNLVGLLIAIGPVLFLEYMEHNLKSNLEDRFPDFLRDVVEGTRAGMTLPKAVMNTKGNDYGDLTPYVNEIAAKIDWGIPFEKALTHFSKKSKSRVIKRSVNTIIQTYRSGGNISAVLESVGNNLKEIKKLRSDRQTQLYGEMITLYVVYFVFLAVLIVLMNYLLPSLSITGDIGPLKSSGTSLKSLIENYRSTFTHLIVIQSIFSGLVIGKLSEGEFRASGKHIAILLIVGYSVSILFL